MTLTVLFDLDDTLLQTNMAAFIPAYFHALGAALSDLGPTQQIAAQIQYAVKQMEANQDPAKRLDEIFARHFYRPLGTTEAAQREVLNAFYREAFPKLQAVITPRPEAQPLIEWCRAQDMPLAIATNPLFPEIATRQRIGWAGLDSADFAFFSTFDNFHFTKPNLAYYAECLGRLGWPEGTAVMIGDNLSHDILPMEALGYPTFWIQPEDEASSRPHGPLNAVQAWLSKISRSVPTPLQNTPEAQLAVLRSTPAILDNWVKEIPGEAFGQSPAPNEWNLTEVFWHLADMEKEVYLPQWQQLLANPHTLLTSPDTSNWAMERGYRSRPPQEALAAFMAARKASLACIKALEQKEMLSLTIQHTIFSHAEIAELISFAAKHDRIHVHQGKNLLDIYKIY